jgi:hypothetical protein
VNYSKSDHGAIAPGDFVELHQLGESDLERVRSWRNAPHVARFHVERDPISAPQQQAWYARLKDDPNSHYWIIRSTERHPIGLVQIKDIHPVHRRGEMGIYIGELDHQGGMWAAEAFYLALGFAFDVRGLHKLYGHYQIDNERARRLNAHFGFREEARLREHVFYDGCHHDYVGVGLLRADFDASPGVQFFSKRRRRREAMQ